MRSSNRAGLTARPARFHILGPVLRGFAIVIALLTLVVCVGCGGEERESGETRAKAPTDKAPTDRSRSLTFAQVTSLRFGTPRARVVRQIGPPVRRQKVKPYGVVAKCYRYRAVDDATGRTDPRLEFRLCYNRRDRLSLRSTAPPEE